jgi:hypothetical protein
VGDVGAVDRPAGVARAAPHPIARWPALVITNAAAYLHGRCLTSEVVGSSPVEPCRPGLATRRSPAPRCTRRWHRIGSRTFGGIDLRTSMAWPGAGVGQVYAFLAAAESNQSRPTSARRPSAAFWRCESLYPHQNKRSPAENRSHVLGRGQSRASTSPAYKLVHARLACVGLCTLAPRPLIAVPARRRGISRLSSC